MIDLNKSGKLSIVCLQDLFGTIYVCSEDLILNHKIKEFGKNMEAAVLKNHCLLSELNSDLYNTACKVGGAWRYDGWVKGDSTPKRSLQVETFLQL